jgi:murein DD-endopeptidase MepM/ murein hydrolase activator NlpD
MEKLPVSYGVSSSDLITPVDESSIPGFREWVEYNGMWGTHRGFDFAAYRNADNKVILGLPKGTIIRAVYDGNVSRLRIPHNQGLGYSNAIFLTHGEGDGTAESLYTHITAPSLEVGHSVKKGQEIAEVFISRPVGGDWEKLNHLHYELSNDGFLDGLQGGYLDKVNPEAVFFGDKVLDRWDNVRKEAGLSQPTLDRIYTHPKLLGF